MNGLLSLVLQDRFGFQSSQMAQQSRGQLPRDF
jgi:hypothetical protein